MAANRCWLLILVSSLAYGQKPIAFQSLSKFPAVSGTAIGYAKDDKSIFLRDWENYYHYSLPKVPHHQLRRIL